MTTTIAASTIAAQAFRFMELSPISSFDDDTEKARDAAEQYPVALQTCLEACDWSFASVMVFLPELAATAEHAGDPDLPHLYALPGQVIVLREVGDSGTRWRLDRGLLRTDAAAPLRIRYTSQLTDEGVLPATFRTAVALHLAALLGPRHLGTSSKIEAIEQRAARALKAAMGNDARNASTARYDGLTEQADWVEEARW